MANATTNYEDTEVKFPPCVRLSERRRGFPRQIANAWLRARGAKADDDDCGFYSVKEFARLSGLSEQTLWRKARDAS